MSAAVQAAPDSGIESGAADVHSSVPWSWTRAFLPRRVLHMWASLTAVGTGCVHAIYRARTSWRYTWMDRDRRSWVCELYSGLGHVLACHRSCIRELQRCDAVSPSIRTNRFAKCVGVFAGGGRSAGRGSLFLSGSSCGTATVGAGARGSARYRTCYSRAAAASWSTMSSRPRSRSSAAIRKEGWDPAGRC